MTTTQTNTGAVSNGTHKEEKPARTLEQLAAHIASARADLGELEKEFKAGLAAEESRIAKMRQVGAGLSAHAQPVQTAAAKALAKASAPAKRKAKKAAKTVVKASPKTAPAQSGTESDNVLKFLASASEGKAMSQIENATGLDKVPLRKILKDLSGAGKVRIDGKNRGTRYFFAQA